jgi:hypothetical protein
VGRGGRVLGLLHEDVGGEPELRPFPGVARLTQGGVQAFAHDELVLGGHEYLPSSMVRSVVDSSDRLRVSIRDLVAQETPLLF